MRVFRFMKRACNSVLTAVVCLSLAVAPTLAQEQAPPSFTPDQIDHIVSRIALYPDPLLAQVLTASTFPDQIPDAAQ